MTLGFALLTAGAALIYTGFKNMTMADLALGRPGPGQPPPIADVEGVSTGTDNGGATGNAPVNSKVSGVVNWRGTPVAKWLVPVLNRAVEAGWDGCLNSGYRTPAEQAAACAQTSGPCAAPGQSNHQGKRYPGGAVDVCNPASFQAAMNKIGNPLRNSLGASDPVHFSVSGR